MIAKRTTSSGGRYDEIGYWSEIKLDIVKEYAAAYSRILSAQASPKLHHVYIDAFAGAGVHLSRETGQFVPGSPTNALWVDPPFSGYHFIDLDGDKVESLKQIVGERPDVVVHRGDCNKVLLQEVFPTVRWENFRRALCLLDPYGLHLNWEVLHAAGSMRSIDVFLNFPVADMNRNVLWRNPEKVDSKQAARMNAFWGDDSWRGVAYESEDTLFGEEPVKVSNDRIAEAFRQRLIKAAGFRHVPAPIPMRNSQNAVVYFLFFASQKEVAADIMTDIFKKYRDRGMS